MASLDVVCWKWRPWPGYRSTYGAETVNTLRRMVARHYPAPHRFSCITDDPAGIDPDVRIIPLWSEHGGLRSPHGRVMPSCYRRLRAFSRDAASIIGPRFVSVDLDTVIVGDLRPLWDRPDDFVMCGGTAAGNYYNGSMWLMSAGARVQVWEEFDPMLSPRKAHKAGFLGSDQAHICATLGPGESTWTQADGVYSWRLDMKRTPAALPKNARIVMFHGSNGDPWSPRVQKLAPWVIDHWR